VPSREFVYEKFCEFYNKPSTYFPSPVSFTQREFAFLLFKERVMVRHKSFANSKSLGTFIKSRIPSDVYHSCAYYESPDLAMEKKGWIGADLVFDIDADHIQTSCNKIHDEWTCCNDKCGFNGKGITPDSCPLCGGVKFDVKTWACNLCIDSTRTETRKLIGMLTKDFGLSEKEIHTFFSGHRGYHIHVETEAVRSLDSLARKEIVDYVSGTGLSLFDRTRNTSPKLARKTVIPTFKLSDFGWKKRLKEGLREFVQNTTKEDLISIGLTKKSSNLIFTKKESILKQCIDESMWNAVTNVGVETWLKLAEYVQINQSAHIDTVVTSDIHRLIRASGTLHGKTGLLKLEFPVEELDCFDPFKEAVAFKEGFAKVLVSNAPEFCLNEETFGPYKNQIVKLPTAAAILLICKDRAEVLDNNV
jgi:DNA primase small subunit